MRSGYKTKTGSIPVDDKTPSGLRTDQIQCPTCGYDLRGAASGQAYKVTCPECGAETSTVEALRTTKAKVARQEVWLVGLGLSPLIIVLGIYIVGYDLVINSLTTPQGLLVGLFLLGALESMTWLIGSRIGFDRRRLIAIIVLGTVTCLVVGFGLLPAMAQ